jgi:hypothetical protein
MFPPAWLPPVTSRTIPRQVCSPDRTIPREVSPPDRTIPREVLPAKGQRPPDTTSDLSKTIPNLST